MRNNKYSLIFVLTLVLLGITLSIVNYTPHTYLTGWDTLHPEFNFKLNFWRTFFGVWREEQGVGVVAAHSHMSEIPRIFLLWLASFVFPVSLLRYFYFFLTLVIGPLGVFFFINFCFAKKNFLSKFASFLGAAYYLLNLGTLQHYYVPFEMFATQFAVLPWFFLLTLKFLNQGRRKHLLIFSIISLLATSMAYAATLFYAFIIAFFLFLLTKILLEKDKKLNIKRSLAILGVLLATNSFWFLPNLYTVAKQGSVIRDSKINQLFSPEAFLRNKEYGSLSDIVLHKNFLFSWREYADESRQFVDLLDEWNKHLAKPKVELIGYLIASLSLLGLMITLIKREKVGLYLLPVVFISLFFLINDNPPTGTIYTLLYNRNELFREALRLPFTKFSILFMFAASFYLSLALNKLFSIFSKKRLLLPAGVFLGFSIFISLILFMKPAFEGNLISPSMRIKIPEEYFAASNWFNQQEKGRIAKLPLHSFWGWIYYDWGFEGAGFNWFDIESPLLERDFDRWSQNNESFYKEASNALYDKDLQGFEKVLQKYQVRYLLLDESVINPSGDAKVTFIPETKELLSASSRISLVKTFGFVSVYKSDFDFGKNFVWSPKSYSKINADLTYSQSDPIFNQHGTYVEGRTYYPFVNFDEKTGLKIFKDKDTVSFSQEVPENVEGTLILPDYQIGSDLISADVNLEKAEGSGLNLKLTIYTPEILLDENKVSGEEISGIYRIPVTTDNLGFIQIGSEVFEIKDEGAYLGRVSIRSQDVALKLYAKTPFPLTDLIKVLSESPRLCSDPTTKIAQDVLEGEYTFRVRDKSVCWGAGAFISSNALLLASYESKSPDNLYPSFCVTKAGRDGCINNSLPNQFLQNGQWSKYVFRQPVEQGDYWVDFVGQAQEKGQASISFKDLEFVVFPQINESMLPLARDLKGSRKDMEIKIPLDVDRIEVKVKTEDEINEQIVLGRGHAKALNCDAVKVGSAQKEIEGGRVKYSASAGGVSCDFRDYPNLDLNQAYLLTITGENDKGRSIKIYLQNKVNNRIELEELLPNSTFSTGYVLPPKKEGKGYLLNYETRSFGKLPSSNYLESISFTPIPFNWLNSLKIKGYEAVEVTNNLAIAEVEKIGTSYYKVTVASPGKEGLIVLGQGYDSGWIALTNFHLLEHVKVNSWANGFFVPEGQHSIVIIFWPQYLEYLGMVLGVGVVLCLAIKRHQKVSIPL